MAFRYDLLQRAIAAVLANNLKNGDDFVNAQAQARHLCQWKSDRCLQYIITNPPGLYWHQPSKQVVEVVDYLEEQVKGHCSCVMVEAAELGRVRAARADIRKLPATLLQTASVGDCHDF